MVAIACVLFVVAIFGWRASESQESLKSFTRSDTELALGAQDVLAKAGIASPHRFAYGGFRPRHSKRERSGKPAVVSQVPVRFGAGVIGHGVGVELTF